MSHYIEVWDGRQWQRLPGAEFATATAASRYINGRSLGTARVRREKEPKPGPCDLSGIIPLPYLERA